MAYRGEVNKARKKVALNAARFIRSKLGIPRDDKNIIGLVLGTGWGDVLQIEGSRSISFHDIPGFEALGLLTGHARKVIFGQLAGKNVIILSGRVHLNEAPPSDPNIYLMARLQIEMLMSLGVRTLVLTSAVGGLGGKFKVGEIAVIDSLITLFAPAMPLYAGEFVSPEDTLNEGLVKIACEKGSELNAHEGSHVMVRGPFFEGRKRDKGILRSLRIAIDVIGADVVGMSILPEACIAGLYNARVLALGFVTNDDVAAHSHKANLRKAKEKSAHLGAYLTRIVSRI